MPLSEPERQVEARDLITHIDQLQDELAVHRRMIASQGRRVNWVRRGMLAALVVAVLGVAVGAAGAITANDVSEQTAAIREVRETSRVGACIQANVLIAQTRAALKASLLALAPDPANLTERQQQLIDAYNASVDLQLPFRDCTPAGIDAYYEAPPADPAD
jgi:hypothetical protein